MIGRIGIFLSVLTWVCCVYPLLGSGEAQLLNVVYSGKVENHSPAVVQKRQQSILKLSDGSNSKRTVRPDHSRVSRSSQRFLQELPAPTSVAVQEESTDSFAAVVAYGWQEYHLGNYLQSKKLFTQAAASQDEAVRHNAESGLLYTYLKLGDTVAAFPLLQQFVARGEQLETTVPALAAILFDHGDFAALQDLLPKLSAVSRKEWQEKIVLSQFQDSVLQLSGRDAPEEIEKIVRKYEPFLKKCRNSEQFFGLAVNLTESTPDLSAQIFTDLGECFPEDQLWQERVLREQLNLRTSADLLAMASRPPGRKILESTWNILLQEAMWRSLKKAEEDSPEYQSLLKALYRLKPQNTEVASMVAWSCYRHEDYSCAEDVFSVLVQKNPSDDVLLGLVYVLQKRGKLAEAVELLNLHPDTENTVLLQQRHELYAALGIEQYEKKRYKEAIAYLQQALVLQPENRNLTEMLLWSRFHLGEPRPLIDFFWRQYQEIGSFAEAKELADLLETQGDPTFTRQVMKSFAQSEVQSVRKLAGDYTFGQGHPVRASQIYQGESPYAGSADPALDSMVLFRSKEGDEGLSSLNVSTLIIQQRVLDNSGRTWSISLFPLDINSGSLPAGVPVGKAFRRLQGIEGDPEQWQEHVLAWGWRGSLSIEGDIDWHLSIGTTPLDGVVAATPVGKIEASGTDWLLAVARNSVKDSLLSWVGQTDPYSGENWGRVVQSSLSAEKTISLSDWWLAFEGVFGWYDGENVEENSSLSASLSGGYTTTWKIFEQSSGLFLFGRGFRHNSNFYTFGHGGYYSPAKQIIAGPFFRLVTSAESDFWLDISLSAGLNYRKTDDANHYVETGETGIETGDPALDDFLGVYKGESETGLGVDARIRGLLPLYGGWFVGGEATINNVADFTQWQLAALLRYRFGEGMGLGRSDREFSMLTRLIQ